MKHSFFNTSRLRRGMWLTMVVVIIALAALPYARTSLAAHPAAKGTINIGVKNFAESQLMADMYQLLLEKQGFTVNQHMLSETPALQAALLKGSIDLYPEYTGTGLLVLNPNSAKIVTNPTHAFNQVYAGYKNRWNLIWLHKTPMNDTNGVAVTQAMSKKDHLHNLSDLAMVSKQLSFAADPACRDRMDCLKGMQIHYGIQFKKVVNVASGPLRYKGLRSNAYDTIEVFTTDAPIQANHLVVLADNKHKVFPADNAAPVVRHSILVKYPVIESTLNKLAPHITTPVMINLNGKVILHSQDAMKVAQAFLKHIGLL